MIPNSEMLDLRVRKETRQKTSKTMGPKTWPKTMVATTKTSWEEMMKVSKTKPSKTAMRLTTKWKRVW